MTLARVRDARLTVSCVAAWLWLLLCQPLPASGQAVPPPVPTQAAAQAATTPETRTQLAELKEAAQRLPLAAALASLLALRPRRPATPRRRAPVIQTQIILAVIGSLVMLVVGVSLARAFGIVGAAGLVRYRAKVDDPKDAGVMLCTLGIGLATGVGQWLLACFGTVFILLVLWVVESFEPAPTRVFALRVKAKDPVAMKPRIEALLNRQHARFEIRAVTSDELLYEIVWPIDRNIDRVSERIVAMDPSTATEVQLEVMKRK